MNVSNKFKNTEIGRIPKEWEVVTLRNIVENDNDIVAGPFGSNLKVSNYRENGIPIIRLQNIERNEFIHKDIKYITNAKAEELEYHSFKTGDIVLAKPGDPIGKACIVPSSLERGIVVADVVRIRVSPRRASIYFLEYVLNSPTCTVQLQKETIGTTRPRVNISQIRHLKLPLPRLPEQKKIAEILSTVDGAIGKVGDAIERTQRLKRGLMQELLTRGIGHEEFKDTEIGRMPKEWEVVKINRLCRVRRGASPRPIGDPSYFSDSGRGWIRISDVTNTYKYLRKTTQHLSGKGVSRSVKVNPGDLIMSICATIGKPIILDMEACIHDGFVWFSDLSGEVNVEYLFYVLQMNEIKFVNMKQTGTQGNLNTTLVGKMNIPLPPLSEQQKIAEVLSTVDKRLGLLREKKERFARVKKGLMNDLLTGRKRVLL